MTIATLIGGRYSSTLNSADLGITETGYEIVLVPKAELISQSDAYGDTLIDFFFRGCDVSCIFDSLEYKTGPVTAAWPWGTLGAMGIIGRLGSGIATSHVMTSTAGTPAVASPTSLTGARAILSPGFNVALLFNSKLRKVPVRFDYLPSDAAVHFVIT